MARNWGQGDSLRLVAPTLAGELARHDRAAFERASASPAMIRALVESLTVTDVRSRLASVAVPALVVHRRSEDFVPLSEARLMASGISGARLVELEGSRPPPVGRGRQRRPVRARPIHRRGLGTPGIASCGGGPGAPAAAARFGLGGPDRRGAAGGRSGGRGAGQPGGGGAAVPVPVHGGDAPEARVRQAGRVISRGTCCPGPIEYLNSGMLARRMAGNASLHDLQRDDRARVRSAEFLGARVRAARTA